MNPEELFRLNNRINSIIDPFTNNPFLSKDWINQISNIGIKPVDLPFLDTTDIFKKMNQSLYIESFSKIDSFIDFSSINLIEKLKFHYYNFTEIIENYDVSEEKEREDVLDVKKIIINETEYLKDMIFDIYINNQKLHEISPRSFEKMIAELLFEKGFEVELTKQTRDNGYDILALKHLDGFSPIKYLVECKKYKPERKIGVEIIRSFKEVLVTEQANKGIIVTTSYFSKDAIIKQKETPLLLDYKDKDEVMGWVKSYYLKKS